MVMAWRCLFVPNTAQISYIFCIFESHMRSIIYPASLISILPPTAGRSQAKRENKMPLVRFGGNVDFYLLTNALDVMEKLTVENSEIPVYLKWWDEGLLLKIATDLRSRKQDACLLTVLKIDPASFQTFECTGPFACFAQIGKVNRVLRLARGGNIVCLDSDWDEEEDPVKIRRAVPMPGYGGYHLDNPYFEYGDTDNEDLGAEIPGILVSCDRTVGNKDPIRTKLRCDFMEADFDFEPVEANKRVEIQADVLRDSLHRFTGVGKVYISSDDEEFTIIETFSLDTVVLDAELGECTIEYDEENDYEMELVALSPAAQAALHKAATISSVIQLLGTADGTVTLDCEIPQLGRIRFCEADD